MLAAFAKNVGIIGGISVGLSVTLVLIIWCLDAMVASGILAFGALAIVIFLLVVACSVFATWVTWKGRE